MSNRDEFIDNVRRALGRRSGDRPDQPPDETALSRDAASVASRAAAVLSQMKARAKELASDLTESAEKAGWTVRSAGTPDDARDYVMGVARDLEARSVVRSSHAVLDTLGLDPAFAASTITLRLAAVHDESDGPLEAQRAAIRESAIEADLGITGVDYAIAETGSCVIVARKGVSRLASLTPPVHIAVVEVGQVLPSLDELFTLRRQRAMAEGLEPYVNIITGPSRSADIEQTIVTGVHGPREVHMVILG